ncbi:MAG: endonuclease/exonuclease/phosphatase family protein [Verrucomicrobiota bacterium JB023]|nr:endonuclease/exonuclease/phosphatase family protein [Verrucomicrobiota bacterium JB023]
MIRPRHPLGITLVVLSLCLHLGTVFLYLRQPDAFAAFTVMPVWFWSLLGLGFSVLAYFVFRTPLSLMMSGIWFMSLLLLSDEATVLGRFDQAPLTKGVPAPHAGRSPYRIATINWAGANLPLTPSLKEWQPDIIFIQEMPHPYLVKQLAEDLFGQTGDYRYDENHMCGLVVRGTITKALLNPVNRSQYLTVRTHRGDYIELVNLHLQPASTNLSLWDPACWKTHYEKRKARRREILFALAFLEEYTPYPRGPAIIAGDFNTQATDSAIDVLKPAFTDTFRSVGTGWGNTYHRRLPFLRSDQIHASQHFLPLRSRVVTIPESDHRLLISDLLLE